VAAALTLYGYWRSSSAWRVRIGLNLKGLAYDTVPVHLVEDGGQQYGAAHSARNPMHQVPVLAVQSGEQTHHVVQSMAILALLDTLYPEVPLVPADPFAAAQVRAMAELVNAGIQPVQNLWVLQQIDALGGDRLAWGKAAIIKGFDALEAMAADTAGTYLMGDTVTLADLYLVPQLYNARRFQVELEAYPTLCRVERACEALPAFAAAHPDRQPDAP
jgi:maleylpyruvate isomerase